MLRFVFVLSCLLSPVASGADPQPAATPRRMERVQWTTSKVIGSPEPPPKYKTQRAFPKLSFSEPLDAVAAPGAQRIFVAERKGKIWSFVADDKTEKADLAYDFVGKTEKGEPLPRTVYAMTVHPKFAENGYVYVTYVPDTRKDNVPNGTRVSRFKVSGDPPKFDAASEKTIIEWHNGGHNGGALQFGNDGLLYIVTGDASGIADERQTGQDISDLFGSILRIDVDSAPADKGYVVPKDNPFVGVKDAKPEIWAYGLRQVWRFSFNRADGQLWAGEVGQDLWEMVYAIERGGNYGWSVSEGLHPFRPERKLGPSPILKPVVEHSHSDFRSITGGYIYRGKKLPELSGHYIYGDFDTGRIWSFQPTNRNSDQQFAATNHGELARTTYRIVSFCEDQNNELLLVDFMGGGLHSIVPAPAVVETAPFPKKLSETGIFKSTKDHQVAAGIVPYSVNAELWSDHAVKERFIAIPGDGKIGFDEIVYPEPPPGAPAGWKFPDGTVLVKSFFMDMERGNPASRKRLETRLLHFQQFPGTSEVGDQYWRGYTYVWNDEQTDAELLDGAGLDKTLLIKDGDRTIEQVYRFPSRAECALCHNNAAKFALGVSTLQLNRDHDYGGGKVLNQLTAIEQLGLFEKPLPKKPADLPKLVNYDDGTQPLDVRARAYLHSNCAHCHTKWGGGNAEFKLTSTLPLEQLGIAGVKPGHGAFGLNKAALISPGHPESSVILHRMKLNALGRMPHIGSKTVHDSAVKLVEAWIRELSATATK